MTTLPQVKAISIDQPMPTAILLDLKGWETRTGPPAGDMCPDGVRPVPGHALNRGDRVLLHATRRVPWKAQPTLFGDRFVVRSEFPEDGGPRYHLSSVSAVDELVDLPLGRIVGSAEIVDAVPILDRTGQECHRISDHICIDGTTLTYVSRLDEGYDMTDQMPWGDWEDGRWAWKLDAVYPVSQMCSKCSLPIGGGPGGYWHLISTYEVCPFGGFAEPFDGPVPVRGKQGVWMT